MLFSPVFAKLQARSLPPVALPAVRLFCYLHSTPLLSNAYGLFCAMDARNYFPFNRLRTLAIAMGVYTPLPHPHRGPIAFSTFQKSLRQKVCQAGTPLLGGSCGYQNGLLPLRDCNSLHFNKLLVRPHGYRVAPTKEGLAPGGGNRYEDTRGLKTPVCIDRNANPSLRGERCVRPTSWRRLSRGRWLPRRQLSWWRVSWRWAFPQQRWRQNPQRWWRWIPLWWGRTRRRQKLGSRVLRRAAAKGWRWRTLRRQECASRVLSPAAAEGWRLV
jgi:hypothetical protein